MPANRGWQIARIIDWQSATRDPETTGLSAVQASSLPGKHSGTDVAVYLAPESELPYPDPVDLDVFGLGALTYLVLSGQPPAAQGEELISRLQGESGLRPSAAADGISPTLDDLVFAATRSDINERLASAEGRLGSQGSGPGAGQPGARPVRRIRLVSGQDYAVAGRVGEVKWARESYAAIRADRDDVSTMTDHLAKVACPSGRAGFSLEELAQVKNHLFVQEQLIEDYETGEVVSRRFDPDAEIAAAWGRLKSGREQQSDLVLLEHELVESSYLKANRGAMYQEAHRHANKRYSWQSMIENG
jgi:hypothetical protein